MASWPMAERENSHLAPSLQATATMRSRWSWWSSVATPPASINRSTAPWAPCSTVAGDGRPVGLDHARAGAGRRPLDTPRIAGGGAQGQQPPGVVAIAEEDGAVGEVHLHRRAARMVDEPGHPAEGVARADQVAVAV